MKILESASLIPLHHLRGDAGVVFTKGNAFFPPQKINDDGLRLWAGEESSLQLQVDTQLPCGDTTTQELLSKVSQHPTASCIRSLPLDRLPKASGSSCADCGSLTLASHIPGQLVQTLERVTTAPNNAQVLLYLC